MIKIPLSYRIIKNQNISSKEDISPIDTKFELPLEEKPEIEEDISTVDLEKIRQEIKDEIWKSQMGEIQREKQKILTQAMEEANTIREQAQNLGYEAGFKEGTEKGYEKAIRDAQEEAEEIKNKAKELIVQSEEYIEEYLEENRKNIIQLAATMAESIVHETIDTSSEKLLLLIKPILQQFNKGKNIIITCDPENEDYLKSRLEELKSINNDVNFVVLKDSSLEKNGCIIENEQQVLDLQISKQIHNILKDIKDME
ncbi:FliH/SctL family protein [Wansuia hejianensis]|uniref:Flagellar assembly protein FliH/Type III secretion system HrpE domain-containing protein n=1 Tax=Wansuia hejianensis TaxID=2763667 RepID=A0A926F1I4_9FIRM|nr:hypothetical protein [Wansuia hejianensis]